MPVIWRPRTQKSMPWLGENNTLEFGAYMNQPPSAAATEEPRRVDEEPPNKKHQNEKALIRGNATSRAPICSGMK